MDNGTNWQIGVTAGPRPVDTLPQTLKSLKAAGFPNPVIFADDFSPEVSGVDVVRRQKRLGAWPNFWLGLTELVCRNPNAEFYMIVQDDVVFYRDTRCLVEAMLPPGSAGIFSLFTPAGYNGRFGWNQVTAGMRMAGGQAIAFRRKQVLEFLGSEWISHFRTGTISVPGFKKDGLSHIDGAVGEWCRLVRKPANFFTPSLSQHIGDASLMHPGTMRNRDGRFADTFFDESLSAVEIFTAFASERLAWRGSRNPAPVFDCQGIGIAALYGLLTAETRSVEIGGSILSSIATQRTEGHIVIDWSPERIGALRAVRPWVAVDEVATPDDVPETVRTLLQHQIDILILNDPTELPCNDILSAVSSTGGSERVVLFNGNKGATQEMVKKMCEQCAYRQEYCSGANGIFLLHRSSAW